jgi:DNA mismatch repair protein MutS2
VSGRIGDEQGESLDGRDRRRSRLEFDDLLEHVASFAVTEPGATRTRELAPLCDLDDLSRETQAVREVCTLVDTDGRLLPGGLPDPRPSLAGLTVVGTALAPKKARDLAAVLVAAAELRERLLAADAESHPQLHAYGLSLPNLSQEAREILRCVDSEGHIADDASPDLQRIRQARSRVGSRLTEMLTRMLRDPDAEDVIQDDFITQRNGRFVIPIRTDSPRPVSGIVHATSSSGATRFVEPLQSVELNNELVRLAEDEREEIERVLLGWSDMLRGCADSVELAVEAVGRLDSYQARAIFAREAGADLARLAEGGPLLLDDVRHPLLDLQLRESGSECVPLNLRLDPADQVLVLSGPNTGGKTVALKTVGLSVLMAQSAIPVPGGRVRLPVYGQVRADIGDHQSIQANLSTFSAHVRAVAGFLDEARPPALFLFDEIGTGTEPAEGAALARSILEDLRVPGATAVATTHQESLKAWALTTEGAAAAAMEFDTESFRPTYRILMGAAGVSAGLDIASRLGLPERVVARAREYLGSAGARTAAYLDRLQSLTAEAEQRRDDADREARDLEEERRRARSLAERAEQRRRREVRELFDAALADLRGWMKKELTALRDKRQRAAAERDMARLERRLRMERSRREAEIVPPGIDAEAGEPARPGQLQSGARVLVRSLAREGEVREVRGSTIEVRVGTMNVMADLEDLRVLPRGPAPEPPRRAAALRAEGRDDAPLELNLIGRRVDEALDELDRFLDAAVMAGHAEIRVIHGHGTGRLRRAVREFLREHRQVKSHRPGKAYEGGDGATMATLD